MIHITCRHVATILNEFVAGELPADSQNQVRGHLQQCPPCVAFVESYQITISISRKLPQRPMPATMQERLKKMMEDATKQ